MLMYPWDGCITEEDSPPVTWDSVAERLYDYLTA